jgi:2,5-diamino-6-(ribosylamino)-4(3H)-pyrimidinone 5'-phosphate reductase
MKRPYVFINCAMSVDGKIASPSGKQMRISCDEDIKRMYELRNDADAVLVGIRTILSDDPKLTVKEKYVKNPKQPIRVVLDTNCRTPINALVVNDTAKTIIFTSKECNKNFSKNVEIIRCKTKQDGLIGLEEVMKYLTDHDIKKLMVEGGRTVISNFLTSGFVDDMFVYVGPMTIGGGNTPSIASILVDLELINTKNIGPGKLLHYRLRK